MIKRVVVLAPDFPYPPNRGDRSDIWRRLLGFRKLGIGVALVSWYSPGNGVAPTLADIETVRSVVSHLHLYTTASGFSEWLARLTQIFKLPSHVSSRRLASQQGHALESGLRSFEPDVLWCEGPYPGGLTLQLAKALACPYWYRSHNVEHLYMRRQAGAARKLKDRLAWRLACLSLKGFEFGMLRNAQHVFDISCDDMDTWRKRGVQNISWLPPIAQLAVESSADTSSSAPDMFDVVFLGNLKTPNNVRGVEWLASHIVPLVRRLRPNTSFLVAGSNPDDHVRSVCRKQPGVTLIENPTDAAHIYCSGRVLVNPVRTGSGIHVKMIEMLMTDAPIVTAHQGIQGFPDQCKSLFLVANTAEQFAMKVVSALNDPISNLAERKEARHLFGVDGLAKALQSVTNPPFSNEKL